MIIAVGVEAQTTDGVRRESRARTPPPESGRNDAAFREGQEEAIRHVVEGRGRLLVVQKTGWGKSFVYFIATKLLREAGAGPALLDLPAAGADAQPDRGGRADGCARGHDQLRQPGRVGQPSRRRSRADEVDILLISPERLANERFRSAGAGRVCAARISLLVIDEAHCISDWGHDFRPHYRLLERIVRTLPPNLRLLATTATANDRVMDDLAAVLGPNLDVLARRL